MPLLSTPNIDIEYEEHGDPSGLPVVLLHGFPDSIRTWDSTVAALEKTGETLRLLVPHMRGFGGTRIIDPQAAGGQAAAFAQDAIDFIRGLGLETVLLVGHDWGARACYSVAVLAPELLQAIVPLATDYVTNGGQPPTFQQVQAYWYQWFFNTSQGKKVLEEDAACFCEYLWRVWSPGWHYTAEDIAAAQAAWRNPQFAETSISSYRHRYGNAPGSPLYAKQQTILDAKPKIGVPTFFACGLDDHCNLPQTSQGQEPWFTGGYERLEIPGVGHFIPHEAGGEVAALIRRALLGKA